MFFYTNLVYIADSVTMMSAIPVLIVNVPVSISLLEITVMLAAMSKRNITRKLCLHQPTHEILFIF